MITDSPGDGVPPIILPEAGVPRSIARWRWWVHLLVLGAYPLVIGGLALTGSNRGQPALTSSVKGVLVISGLELMLFGVIFAVAWIASRATRDQLLLAKRLRFLDIPLSLVYSFGLRIGMALVAAVIASVLIITGVLTSDQVQDFAANNRPDVEALVDLSALQNNMLYLLVNATLVSFIVAGLREELWRAGVLAGLRALWPNRFGSVTGQLAAVAVAAVLFGLGHFSQGALAAFLTAVLGFLLGVIMVLHKSIWPAVLAHGAFNATTFVVLPWVMEYLPHS